jgi:glyoxalase family protein
MSTETKSSPIAVTGIHHVTLVSKDIQRNYDFWTKTLGMRLVKKSVNQDSPSDYHLFYGDYEGSPGTEVTFFDWPTTAPNRPGSDTIDILMLRVVDDASVAWWAERLRGFGLSVRDGLDRNGFAAIAFQDPDGVQLEIVADGNAPRGGSDWPESPVPAPHQIRGVFAVAFALSEPERTLAMLQNTLGFRIAGTYSREGRETTVLVAGDGQPGRQLHVIHDRARSRGYLGHGGIHHVAFRITDYATYDQFLTWLTENRIGHSGPVDRHWFRSIYFRSVEGLVLELATDEPGFATDEPLETLGQHLALAPFLEPSRDQIEAALKKLV